MKLHSICNISGVLAMALFALACASTGSKFAKVYPGMTANQVVQTVGKGPSHVKQFSDDYAAWYYGEDACLLFQSDKVVGKSQTEEKGSLEVFGLGGMSEYRKAECLPPGQKSAQKMEREIETPFGTFRK